MTVTRDITVAVFLLAVSGVLWFASYDIRVPDYGQLSPATWPRIIIGAITLLSFIYLIQSVNAARNPTSADVSELSDESAEERPIGISGFYHYWKNVIWCFVLFGLYLYSLPWLGMLLGALAFVFILLCALGGWGSRQLLLHAAIALVTVGGMWTLFTYGLGVLLPSAELF